MIKDFSVRSNTLKLLDKDKTQTLQDIGIGNDFLERTSNTTENNLNNWQVVLHESNNLMNWKGNNSTKGKHVV